jgi:hypothetical protein
VVRQNIQKPTLAVLARSKDYGGKALMEIVKLSAS